MFANCYEKKHSFVSIANLFVIITVQEIDFIGYLSRLNVIKVVYCWYDDTKGCSLFDV